MAQLRKLIRDADPAITEEWKWGTPVFNHNGLVCAIGAFKDHVKLNFFQGVKLSDPNKLFNSGLDAKTTRSINFQEGDKVAAPALKKLIHVAVAYNQRKGT